MGALSVFNMKEKVIKRQGAGAICPYCGGPILACCYDSNLLFFFISISRKLKTKYFCLICSRRLILTPPPSLSF